MTLWPLSARGRRKTFYSYRSDVYSYNTEQKIGTVIDKSVEKAPGKLTKTKQLSIERMTN